MTRYGGILTALIAAEITGAFETAMIYAGMNKLIATFGDPITVGWLITSYLLIGAGAAAVAGRLGDIYGRRRVIELLLALAAVGSVISAISSNFAIVLLGRSIQGLSAAILPLCIGLVRENLPLRRVPMGIGLMVSGASAGTAIGLVLGGLIVDNFSWRGMFVASAIFSLLSLALVRLFVPRSPRRDPNAKVDWAGGLLFVPAIFGLLLIISKGRDWGWVDLRMITLTAGSIVLLVIWVAHALRQPQPLIDVRLFLDRRVLIANMVMALLAVGALQVTLIFSVLLQAPAWTGVGLGISATAAGLVKLPSNAGALMAGPFSGWLTARMSGRFVMVLAGVICASAWIAVALYHGSVPIIMVILIVMTFGATMLYAATPNLIVEAVPSDRTSEAVGMMSVIRTVALGVGAQLVAVMLASSTIRAPGGGAAYPTAAAVELTMWVVVATIVAATLLSLATPRAMLDRSA